MRRALLICGLAVTVVLRAPLQCLSFWALLPSTACGQQTYLQHMQQHAAFSVLVASALNLHASDLVCELVPCSGAAFLLTGPCWTWAELVAGIVFVALVAQRPAFPASASSIGRGAPSELVDVLTLPPPPGAMGAPVLARTLGHRADW